MKKAVFSLFIVFTVLLLTGCNKDIDFSKTSHIVCTKTEQEDSNTTTTTITFSYDKDEKIEDFKAEFNMQYDSSTSQETMELLAKTMKLISKTLGLGFKSEVEEKRLYYSFTGNIKIYKKLMKALDENYSEAEVEDVTKQGILEAAPKDGYTCVDNKK